MIPCLKTKNKTDIQFISNNWSQHFFDRYWRPFILQKWCKAITFLICLGFLAVSFFAIKNIPEGLDQQLATIKGKNLYNFFGDVKKYIEQGPEASILVFGANYNNEEVFTLFDDLIELISNRAGIS